MNIRSGSPYPFKFRENLTHRMIELSAIHTKSATLAYRREFDIGRPEALIINMVGHYGMLMAADIANISSFDKALVARAIQKLIDKRLLKSDVDDSDRRKHNLLLTGAGLKIFEQNQCSGRQRYEAWIDGLSDADLSALDKLITKLTDNAEEEYRREVERGEKRIATKKAQAK